MRGERERELWWVKYNIPAGGVLCLPMLLCSGSRQSIKGIQAVRMSTGRDPFPISKPHTFSCGAKWFSFTPPAMFVTSLTTLFHCTKEWVMTPRTCPNDFVYGDTRRFQFLGEFVHGLTRVFISVWVHIGLDSRQSHWKENKIMPEFMRQGVTVPVSCSFAVVVVTLIASFFCQLHVSINKQRETIFAV